MLPSGETGWREFRISLYYSYNCNVKLQLFQNQKFNLKVTEPLASVAQVTGVLSYNAKFEGSIPVRAHT